MPSPLVSIIIPTFNRALFLREAIDSVLNQTYAHRQLIVVDDGSTDGTQELLAGYSDQVTIVVQENRGVAAARNRGISEAGGEFIAFLDSDDRFERRKLERQVAAMQESPYFIVSHTQERWYRRGQHLNQKKKHRKESGDLYRRCLELCAVGMSTIMVRPEIFERVGLFNEALPCCEDYDLWLRVSVTEPFLLIDAPLTIKNGGRPDQLSVQYQVGMDAYRVRSIVDLLNSAPLTAEQRCLARLEVVKKATILVNGFRKHGNTPEAKRYQALVDQYACR